MLAITNTPFDEPIKFSSSGRAIYSWRVMHCYLPYEIEPFWDEPQEYDPRDDWHPSAEWLRHLATLASRYQVEDWFTNWRRHYMNWHTAEELRLDEEKRVQNWLASERLIESLNELKKKRKQKNDAKKAVKSRIKKSLTSSRCPVRLQKQPMLIIVQRNSKGRGRGPRGKFRSARHLLKHSPSPSQHHHRCIWRKEHHRGCIWRKELLRMHLVLHRLRCMRIPNPLWM